MQPVVPYWRQPANLGVPPPQPGGGFNLGETLQTASALYNIGQTIEGKQRRQRTKRFMAKQAQSGKPLTMEAIGKEDLDLPLVERMIGLQQTLKQGQWKEGLQLASMTMPVLESLQAETDPHDRALKLQFLMENQQDPALRAAFTLIGQGLQELAVDEQGQPLADEQGRPVLPDEVMANAAALADLQLTMGKARELGMKQRDVKWADKGPVQQVQELREAFPRFNEWTAKELNYMQHGKIGTLPDGTLDLPNFDLLKMTPKADTRSRIKGLMQDGQPAGATGQPGASAEAGPTTEGPATDSAVLKQEIESLTQEDFMVDPMGTRDLLLNFGMKKHEELQKEGVTGALSLAAKDVGAGIMDAGNAIGQWLEGKAANAGELAKGAIRSLPGGGHLVGQESDVQPVSPSDFVAETPAQAPQPDQGATALTEPRRNPKLDRYAGQPLSREYSMAIGRTPDQEDRIRDNYAIGAEQGEQKMASQEEGEAAGLETQGLRDVERLTLDSLIQHEGFDATWRTDRHGEVIGHGLQRKNLEAMLAKTGETVPDRISKAQARQYSMRYVREVALPGARRAIGAAAWEKLSSARKAVLVEMAYQLGEDGLDIGGRKPGFNRMIRAIRAGDFEAAARELVNSDLGRQTPGRAKALAQRLRKG